MLKKCGSYCASIALAMCVTCVNVNASLSAAYVNFTLPYAFKMTADQNYSIRGIR